MFHVSYEFLLPTWEQEIMLSSALDGVKLRQRTLRHACAFIRVSGVACALVDDLLQRLLILLALLLELLHLLV